MSIKTSYLPSLSVEVPESTMSTVIVIAVLPTITTETVTSPVLSPTLRVALLNSMDTSIDQQYTGYSNVQVKWMAMGNMPQVVIHTAQRCSLRAVHITTKGCSLGNSPGM